MEIKEEAIQATVSSPQPSLREIEVEVAWEEVAKEWEKLLSRYVARIKLNGFRPGKAPREMVKRLFFKELKNDLIEVLVPRTMNKVMRERNITPLVNPVVSEVIFRENEPFRFKARVEIFPDFKLPEYKKIRVKKMDVKVEEAEVEASLERLRQDSAEYLPVEGRGVAEGDYVVIEWKGRDARTRRLAPTEKVLVIAGHPDNGPDLNENLIGLEVGGSRRFVTSYPPDYPQKKFAGKTIENEIRVVSIKEKKLPDLNDEWAKDLGEFDNLATLRERIRKELEKSKTRAARQAMGEEAVEAILRDVRLDIPEGLIERESAALVRDWVANSTKTLTAEELENVRQRARLEAERRIKRDLVLRRVAEEEGLEVREEEVDEEIRALARKSNVPPAQLADRVNQEGKREELRASLLLRKAIDFLLENAVLY